MYESMTELEKSKQKKQHMYTYMWISMDRNRKKKVKKRACVQERVWCSHIERMCVFVGIVHCVRKLKPRVRPRSDLESSYYTIKNPTPTSIPLLVLLHFSHYFHRASFRYVYLVCIYRNIILHRKKISKKIQCST